MVLVHMRKMRSDYRCYQQLFKHTLNTLQSLSLKNDCYSLCTKICMPKQYSVACLSSSFSQHSKVSRYGQLTFSLERNFSTSFVHYKINNDVLVSAFNDIDLDELNKQIRKERNENNETVHLIHKVKEAVVKRCNEVLANLSPEDEKKLKVIQLEHGFFLSEGYEIINAEDMTSQNWLEALKLDSHHQRLKYYRYLIKRMHLKANAKLKKAAAKEAKTEAAPYEHGKIFMHIYETTIKRWQNHRLVTSMKFGTPLVIDMDYDTVMQTRDLRNSAEQLQSLYTINRADENMPFHLHFTNCSQSNAIFTMFQILQQEDQQFLGTITEKSYLDLFDKESLVYLSPDGRQVMKEFDPEAVYIIGCFNDKAVQKPLSYARAKEQNIRCERLPLDMHLKWGLGSKSLTLNQIMHIMLAVKNKQSWQEAFNIIPRRKLQKSSIPSE